MRPPDSTKVLPQAGPPGRLKHSYATTCIARYVGGYGGMGDPSATSVGGYGGIGEPSATSVGGYGGMGEPSAISVRSRVTHLPAERLTDRTTGSTIETARRRTATAIAVFFKGVSLL